MITIASQSPATPRHPLRHLNGFRRNHTSSFCRHETPPTLRQRIFPNNGVVRQAADSYARAARVPHARIPRRSRPGSSLRGAARLLSFAGYAWHDPAFSQAALITRLAGLAEAVAELREAQRHAAQAAAARRAAEHLYAAVGAQQARPRPARPRSVAEVIARECAMPFHPDPADAWEPDAEPDWYGSGPTHRPSPRTRRGPGR